MTQEDKKLLLKILCSMLPYGVICKGINFDLDVIKDEYVNREVVGPLTKIEYNYGTLGITKECELSTIKPYLRPMSSMTEEEAITIFKIIYGDDTEFSSVEVSDNCIEIWDYDYNEDGFSERTVCTIYFEEIVRSMEVLDYLLSRYFDIPRWNKSENKYKTIIEEGLALEASEGMYNF